MKTILCKNCQNWKPLDFAPSGYGECKSPMLQDREEKVFSGNGIVVGGDPYYSVFVGANFGCIHGVDKMSEPYTIRPC